MYYMAYFKDEVQKMFLAGSRDLLIWEEMNEGKPVLDMESSGLIVRDPFLLHDRQGRYHVFFTTQWFGKTIGHAVSENLKDWSEPVQITLFQNNEDVYNCWAPECFWDEERAEFCLIWSSSFKSQNSKHEDSNRIWYATSKDLKKFTEPRIFFDPGYPVIDASVIKKGKEYFMAFKDERDFNAPGSMYSAVRTAIAEDAHGLYTQISPILTGWRSEGPMLLWENGQFYIFYDAFGMHRYEGITSRDFIHWESITDKMNFPAGCKHMSIVKS